MPILIEEERSSGVLELRLNRPEKRNALNQELVALLTAAFARASRDDDTRVVLLSGAGDVFSAGADLASLRKLQSASRAENKRDTGLLATLFRSIVSSRKPVVARVHGHAVAGGCGLVAACDFAIGSYDALLGFTEVRIGFVPAIVSVVAANRLRGSDVRRLMLSGDLISAKEAEVIGLLTRAVAPEELDGAVDQLLLEITNAGAQAVSMTKELLLNISGMQFSAALDYASELNARARESEECKEGVAAFLEKRDPKWRPPKRQE